MRRLRNATVYRGVAEKEAAPRDPVPVTEGLVACHVCGGGVRLVGAPWSNDEVGIKKGDRLLGSHAAGGHKKGRNEVPCLGALTRPGGNEL
jgi:hypothetical protein